MAAQLFNFAAPLPGRLYWDASFLIHATYPAGRYHQECFALLDRLSNRSAHPDRRRRRNIRLESSGSYGELFFAST
jgi:hypothetical protein